MYKLNLLVRPALESYCLSGHSLEFIDLFPINIDRTFPWCACSDHNCKKLSVAQGMLTIFQELLPGPVILGPLPYGHGIVRFLFHDYSATKPFDRLTAMSLSAMSSRPNGEVEWTPRHKDPITGRGSIFCLAFVSLLAISSLRFLDLKSDFSFRFTLNV